MTKTKLLPHRVKFAKFHREEGGLHHTYRRGDVVDVSQSVAETFAHQLEPVGEAFPQPTASKTEQAALDDAKDEAEAEAAKQVKAEKQVEAAQRKIAEKKLKEDEARKKYLEDGGDDIAAGLAAKAKAKA